MERGRFDPTSDDIVATVTWLRLVDFDRCDGDEPAQALSYVSKVTAWLDATRLKCVAAAERARTGARDTADVVAGTGVSGRESRRQVRLAEKLVKLPQVADALERGEIAVGHVEAITKSMDVDPAVADAVVAQQAELVARASGESVDVFDRLCKDWTAQTAEAAGVSLGERQRAKRRTSVFDGELGMRILRAELTPEEGATVEHSLRTITDQMIRAARDTKRGDGPVSLAEHTPKLLTDALVEMARRALSGSPGAGGGEAGGGGKRRGRSLPHVIVHVDLHTLRTGERHAGAISETDDGTPLSVEQVQRLLCDATTTGVLFDDLVTLAKGRRIRTADDDLWDVLRARDRGCIFPGCTMRPDFCQAHHIAHWTPHHGTTDPDNLVLVCSRHHHLVHDGHWTLTGPAHAVQIHTPNGGLHWQRTPDPPDSPREAPGTVTGRPRRPRAERRPRRTVGPSRAAPR